MRPKISVVTAVHNCERFITSAIESVLKQTYQDYEMIIVDDASTDGTTEILQQYLLNEKIVVFHNPSNRERSYSRNLAVDKAKGEYIAILDADDLCVSDRFETQVEYMQSHPDIDVLGGNIVLIDENDNELGKFPDFPATHAEIVWDSFFETQFVHSTVIMKREKFIAVKGYNENLHYGEDTDLWIKMIKTGCRMANLPDVLVKYRTNDRQMKSAKDHYLESLLLRKKFLEEVIKRELSLDDYYLFRKIFKNDLKPKFSFTSLIIFSNILTSAIINLHNEGLLSHEDQVILSEKIANNLVYIANRTEGINSELLIPTLKQISTKVWIKYYWQCKKGYLKLYK